MRLTVLDLSRLLPGGYATRLLAHLGARVIKVEEPTHGDYLREFPYPLTDGMSAYFHALNRGKESIAIDLKRDPDRLLELAAYADVLLESFRPGVMDRLGVGYDAVRARNPRIIYCSISGFDPDGDDAQRPGHDLNFVSNAGMLDVGRGMDGHPAMPGLQVADIASGILAALRITDAAAQREADQNGKHIRISMMDAALEFMAFGAAPFALSAAGANVKDLMLHGALPCYRLYRVRDGWISVANLEEKFWQRFCEAAGHPEWNVLHSDTSRAAHEAVEAVLATRNRADWLATFQDAGCCVDAVQSLDEAAPLYKNVYPGAAPPRLGEHTERIFKEFGIRHTST